MLRSVLPDASFEIWNSKIRGALPDDLRRLGYDAVLLTHRKAGDSTLRPLHAMRNKEGAPASIVLCEGLTGPTAAEAREFLADTSADKRTRLVDRLLADGSVRCLALQAEHAALLAKVPVDLAVNVVSFGLPVMVYQDASLSPFPVTGANALARWTMDVFFHQKFITLFSMLFGASIYLVGGERDDAARGKLLRRRLFWLAVIALIHGLAFWYGDVLLLYAWSGLFVKEVR